MCKSFDRKKKKIRSSLTYLHGFQPSVLCMVFNYLCSAFRLWQQNKSSESKIKSRQATNHCKGVLEATKFTYAIKTRVHHFPET